MFNFLPTLEKLRSLSSAYSESVAAVRWCFFLLSFFTVIGAEEDCGIDGALGGVKSDIGSSTCAADNVNTHTELNLDHTIFQSDQFVDEAIVGELGKKGRYHIHAPIQDD